MKATINGRYTIWGIWILVILHPLHQPKALGLEKKLIEYGGNAPFPCDIKGHLESMESKPFDGIVFQLEAGKHMLRPVPLDQDSYEKDIACLREIGWRNFTDNFILMESDSDQDWFDNGHWDTICDNVRLLARAAQEGTCVGFFLNPEPKRNNPWAYSSAIHRDSRNFQEYEAIVRKRGAQFIATISQEMPDCVILFLFQLSIFSKDILPAPLEEKDGRLSFHHYGLIPAFLNGCLEAAAPGMFFVDCNQNAFFYTHESMYFESYHRIRQRAQTLILPELRNLYRSKMNVGQSFFMDHHFGMLSKTVLGNRMTESEQRDWLEHNAYWALYSTDKYVLCCSDRMNWWTGEELFHKSEETVRSALHKSKNGLDLGFDLSPIIELAKLREMAEIASKLEKREVVISRVPEVASPPQIDGHLEDHAWKLSKPLEAFLSLASRSEILEATTTAWVIYDQERLYVAVMCDEPQPEVLYIVGENRDDDVWLGDDLELLISLPNRPEAFFHFMINPLGVYWDSIHMVGEDRSFDPYWERSAQLGPYGWSAEMAIPWSVLQIEKPYPGMRLRANICRQRGRANELSCWSRMADSFLEPELFGTWILE